MGIVRFALKFPHTFYVLGGLMLFLGVSAIIVTPKDIFPAINIPVVTVIWQYTGLTPEEMEQRVTTYSEYSISSNVSDIRSMESQTLSGIAVEKIFFQPNVNIDLAISQVVSASNAIRALMPTGINPPIIVQYNASSVPVLQLSLSSDTLNEQQLYDYGIYQIRQALAPIRGITLPTPYGGKYRQIMVDLDPDALRARGITPADVVSAVNAETLTLPSGDAKLGDKQFIVRVNSVAPTIAALNRLPIKQVGATTVYLADVAHVRDGWAVQQNIVHAEGKRSVLLTIIKNGDASTLDVVSRVKEALPAIQKAAPPGMQIHMLFDQSLFVEQAIGSVLREGAIAAGLTALMILVFLGSWRSTLVVMVSIPLSILTSIAVLSALGETHQHHDPRWPRARSRHPGGRLDGHDREHPSAIGGRQRIRHGGPGGGGWYRGSDIDLDARHLLRLCLSLFPARRGTLPLYAAGDGRRLRDARFLRHLADVDSDHHPFVVAQ
jgi:multidrug efflux pump subunit AcrB